MEITSMYVFEFSEESTTKELFDLFGCIRSIVEVAILPRRNNFWNRSGFARFVEVSDGRYLAVHLDNTIIAGKKIHVKFARFNRGQVRGDRRFGGTVMGKHGRIQVRVADMGKDNTRSDSKRMDKSYAEVAVNAPIVSGVKGVLNYRLRFQSSEERRGRLAKAYVGNVCIPGSAYNIQTHFEMEGVFGVKVSPLGGNVCLLEESEEGFIEDLIGEGKSWWKSWFSEIKKWEEGMMDDCRDAWIRIYGIHVHAWSSEFFVALAESWGRFICIDEITTKGYVFDVARVLDNIPIALTLPNAVTANIDGVNFNV
ncbi:uncharacterized protein LOC131597141 [Vicia villosa]|uniref:uncharacterized protein LOC131597141 n=1 Tax=Vicia villosa TaxID=3911 RepID=UPI00273B1A15|nr:uncharacterized protein LOC131597141 [Vicia villosa]